MAHTCDRDAFPRSLHSRMRLRAMLTHSIEQPNVPKRRVPATTTASRPPATCGFASALPIALRMSPSALVTGKRQALRRCTDCPPHHSLQGAKNATLRGRQRQRWSTRTSASLARSAVRVVLRAGGALYCQVYTHRVAPQLLLVRSVAVLVREAAPRGRPGISDYGKHGPAPLG